MNTNVREEKKMPELWDIYDEKRNKTGRFAQRGPNALKEGEYHIIVVGIIINSKNELLISKRASHKKHPLMWEFTAGSLLAGEESRQGVLRELKEELGVKFELEDAIYFKEIRRDEYPSDFKDMWLFQKDINIKDLTFPDGEATEAKWVTIEQFMQMVQNEEIIPHIDFGLKEYEEILKFKINVNNL